MIVGTLRLVIEISESTSLKDKRAVVLSLKRRIQSRFKVSVAEVGRLDNLRVGELGIVCASNDARQADSILAHIADFAIANIGDGSVSHVETEILHLD